MWVEYGPPSPLNGCGTPADSGWPDSIFVMSASGPGQATKPSPAVADAVRPGGQVAAPVGRNLELRPSGDLFFPRDDGMGWQLNGDAAIRFGQGGGLYGGAGIAFAHPDDSDTKTGYNLFFGLWQFRNLRN